MQYCRIAANKHNESFTSLNFIAARVERRLDRAMLTREMLSCPIVFVCVLLSSKNGKNDKTFSEAIRTRINQNQTILKQPRQGNNRYSYQKHQDSCPRARGSQIALYNDSWSVVTRPIEQQYPDVDYRGQEYQERKDTSTTTDRISQCSDRSQGFRTPPQNRREEKTREGNSGEARSCQGKKQERSKAGAAGKT